MSTTATPDAPPAATAAPAATPPPLADPPAAAATPPPADPPAAPPPPPAPPAAPPPAIGPDGSLADNWFLSLGDEAAAHAKDLGKHKHLKSLITELDYFRKNGVEYPVPGAPPNVVERFRAVAGVPADPAGYQLDASALGLPEGAELDTDLLAAVTTAAHAAHTPPAALQSIARAFSELAAKRAAEAEAAEAATRKAAQDSLVAEWRGDFETNAATVRHYTARLAETVGVAPEEASALANNPAFARIILAVSKLTAEDSSRTPHGFGDLRSNTQKIAAIKSGDDPYWSPLYHSKIEADRLKAYEHVKSLRESEA
jgi:hypothetical protein